MNNAAIAMRDSRRAAALPTVLSAGALAAALDLLFAFTYYGVRNGIGPLRILQTIGSGVLGPAAFDGGAASAGLGLFCHFFILIVAAWLFFMAARHVPQLTRHAFASGIAYGVAIYLVMNFIVVPLSNAPHFKRSAINTIAELGSHLFFVGLAISWLVRRHFRGA